MWLKAEVLEEPKAPAKPGTSVRIWGAVLQVGGQRGVGQAAAVFDAGPLEPGGGADRAALVGQGL